MPFKNYQSYIYSHRITVFGFCFTLERLENIYFKPIFIHTKSIITLFRKKKVIMCHFRHQIGLGKGKVFSVFARALGSEWRLFH